MKISYVRGLEEDGAKFWLSRVGWEPSEASELFSQLQSHTTILKQD
jgi:hypothetical protein